MRTRAPAWITYFVLPVIAGCGSFIGPSHEFSEVTRHRVADQIYLADSLKVFFAEFRNPYTDKEVLWIASYLEGPVELRLHRMETDSLLAIYRFEPQDSPLYPIAYRNDADVMLKCVVYVGGNPKCARLLTWMADLPHPQWGTTYEKQEF